MRTTLELARTLINQDMHIVLGPLSAVHSLDSFLLRQSTNEMVEVQQIVRCLPVQNPGFAETQVTKKPKEPMSPTLHPQCVLICLLPVSWLNQSP